MDSFAYVCLPDRRGGQQVFARRQALALLCLNRRWISMRGRRMQGFVAVFTPNGGREGGKNKDNHCHTAEYSEFSDDGAPGG
ncbi:hypothetical protein ABK905_15665 [Acerihabitans sp. KWT182]|uniref:Uncharacterized protein n=1 Tax=Acerihabitans sp. KWT182 TaxID=3157919 RepID=A0AAU7Q522_9GAMM